MPRLWYSLLVARSRAARPDSSVVEHFHGKEGVVSSILTRGSQHPFLRPDAVWQGSSVGESARLIIVRSRVQAPLLLQVQSPGIPGLFCFPASLRADASRRCDGFVPVSSPAPDR